MPRRTAWASFAGIFIVTNLGLLAVGATLAVLPHYVKDNLNGSDFEVGIVSGAFALTGIVCRPIAGNFADTRGRKPTLIVGALLAAELQYHVKRVTAPYKYPRIVEFAEELPKTPSGKIRRAELRGEE